jgi:hypothetical protein
MKEAARTMKRLIHMHMMGEGGCVYLSKTKEDAIRDLMEYTGNAHLTRAGAESRYYYLVHGKRAQYRGGGGKRSTRRLRNKNVRKNKKKRRVSRKLRKTKRRSSCKGKY